MLEGITASLSEIGLDDLALVGGKGANLGHLIKGGFSVPPGFCVKSAAYESFVAQPDLAGRVQEILEPLDLSDLAAVEEAAAGIRGLFLSVPLPAPAEWAIAAAYRELLEEVGRDVARYIFLTRSQDTALDFDIQLAKEESMENPVYYVQYAHARICSILRYGTEKGVEMAERVPDLETLRLLGNEEETDLALKIFEFEELVRDASLDRAPHRLTRYLEDLAAAFHLFYTHHRVIGEDSRLTEARLFLVRCTRQVLVNGLAILGVSAPESM
jgi:8-oxo-dGTP pyrophosphatase MutT (NUDIX family)